MDLSSVLEEEGIFVCDASDIVNRLSINRTAFGDAKDDRFYMLKPVALAYSRFRHVLLLDADNFPVRNPEGLFTSAAYLKTGALFWPDFWPLESSNAKWVMIGKPYAPGPQQESGQIVVDKVRHWHPLVLALYMNMMHDVFYESTSGDKETFHYSWRAMDAAFTMIPYPTGASGTLLEQRVDESSDVTGDYLGHTMVQHGVDGECLFFHRNLRKWSSGFKPIVTENLTMVQRTWLVVKECAGKPVDCVSLLTYQDGHGGLRWLEAGKNGVYTTTMTMERAVGWDVEAAVMKAFLGLWDIPEYATYMAALNGEHGIPGSYHRSCHACKYADEQQLFGCTCDVTSSVKSLSTWIVSPGCLDLSNADGKLWCADWAAGVGLPVPSGSFKESCRECHYSLSNVLYCKCKNVQQKFVASSLSVNKSNSIENAAGQLTFKTE